MLHPARTWLFVPGSDAGKLAKARTLPADAVIYDLEDAVAEAEKPAARRRVRDEIRSRSRPAQYVRVNDLTSPFFQDDVRELADASLRGIVVPKAEKAETIRELDGILVQLEKERGIPPGSIELVPMIESARGVLNAHEIASSVPRVRRLAFGAVDFTLDVGARLTPAGLEVLYARSQVVVASRAAGIEAPVDTAFIDIRDTEGLQRDALLARQLGFAGKLVIHPAQIGIVNEVFTPTREEIEEARRIVAAFEEARAKGLGAIQVDGRMIDPPVARRAERLLRMAAALQMET